MATEDQAAVDANQANDGADGHDTKIMLLHLMQRGLAVLVLLAVLGGLYLFWQLSDAAPTLQTPPPQPPPVVSTIVVQGETVPLRPRYLGQVEASQVVEIRARVDGFLQQRAFEEGARVEPDQLLYRIDPSTFQAQLAIANARLASAQAQLELAREQYGRYQQLAREGAATSKELEEGRTAVRVAEAQVQLSQAQVAQAKLDLSYTTIRSPIRGLVGESRVDEGTYVSTGAESLLAVVSQIDPIYVRLSVSEEEALRFSAMVAKGQIETPDLDQYQVLITLSTGQVYEHRGRVDFVDVRVDPSTGTRVLRVVVPNPDRLLVPGQFVHADILGAARTGTILVPQAAVAQTPTGSSVYVVRDDGTIEQRPITLGQWYEDRWIVEAGLEPDDRVAIDQLMRLRPGMKVKLNESHDSATSDH